MDLRADWSDPLRRASFDPTVPTAWLIEGLLIYLSAGQATELLTTVTNLSAVDSQVAFKQSDNTRDPEALQRIRQAAQLCEVTQLWQGGLGEDAEPWLTRRGWSIRSTDRAELAATYGRTDPGRQRSEFLVGVYTGPA